jgi:hypothetical protein
LMHPEPAEQCYVRVKAPPGIGAVQTFSNRHLTVGLDGIVEMSEEDAACLNPCWLDQSPRWSCDERHLIRVDIRN